MKFVNERGALVHHTYRVDKYSGGKWCGCFDRAATIDQCMQFANDGFCDYCRITCDDGSVLKVHFTTPELENGETVERLY